MRARAFCLGLILAASAGPSVGQGLFPSGERLAQSPDRSLLAPNAVPKHIDYGPKRWQEVDFFPPAGVARAPLVIAFASPVAGWPRYQLNRAGIALAIVPNPTGEPDARKKVDNQVAAIAHIYRNAERLGIDRERLAILGYGNAGSLATLFGTDPALLARAGAPLEHLRGVVSLGGEDFDVAQRMAENSYLRSRYHRYYSSDEGELLQLSPAAHLQAPNAPAFLLLATEKDKEGVIQSERMARALSAVGTPAHYATLPEQREGFLPSYFMAEPDGSGREVVPFLQAAFRITN
jgi:arylformamidase